ncbi:hypothetical protein ACQPZZ_04430 [Microbispora sp. CA-135349]|uniref:hypothetical protein n=1 Tax=Microbispora sp. CA-135349 TaxID=3239953 RepID=UPI003D945405
MSDDPDGWKTEHRLSHLMSYPYVSFLIQQAAQGAQKQISAEKFLAVVGGSIGAATGMPLLGTMFQAGSVLAQLYGAMGVKVQKSRRASYQRPIGQVIVALLCALARGGYSVNQALQDSSGCAIKAHLPSSWLSWKGTISAAVAGDANRTYLEVGIHIPGQAYDWGRSNKILVSMFSEIERDIAY